MGGIDAMDRRTAIAVSIGLIILVLWPSSIMAQGPWQEITMPSIREAAASFATPPRRCYAFRCPRARRAFRQIPADAAR